MTVVRLGAVSFLNARPLTAALADGDGCFDLIYDVPSACSAALRQGRIDLGLIPSIEYATSPAAYCIVPDIAIGCNGEVLTVRLFFRGDPRQIRRVAVDTSSQTSVALLRIPLKERYGLAPEFRCASPDLDAMLHGSEAALLIGDPVLPLVDVENAVRGDSLAGASERRSLDLGSEWRELTGLPFVFAFWAGREGAVDRGQVEELIRARCRGAGMAAEISRAFQRERAGPAELYERYLRDHITYDLGEGELRGLREFYRLARVHGVIEAEPELRFYDRPELIEELTQR